MLYLEYKLKNVFMIKINGKQYLNSKVEFVFKDSKKINIENINIDYWIEKENRTEYFISVKYGVGELDKIKKTNNTRDLLCIPSFNINISFYNDNTQHEDELFNCEFDSSGGHIIYAGIIQNKSI